MERYNFNLYTSNYTASKYKKKFDRMKVKID